MSKVTFDYSRTAGVVRANEMESMKAIAESARELLLSRQGAGNDFLGWIDLPVDYDKEEFARILKAAEKIQKDSEVLLVIGIGGSYLAPGQPLSSCVIISIIPFQRRSVRLRRFILWATASAVPT